MYALDFEYDGQYLSDYGFIICNFGSQSDFDTLSAGSKITFNKVAKYRGKSYSLTGTTYDECITANISICKNPDIYEDLRISNDEYRDIMRWLNRREFLTFQVLNEDGDRETCFFEASFNVDKVLVSRVLYGFNLTMETNKPFGYGQELAVSWTVSDPNKPYILSDMSDEIGYIYPSMTIIINRDGNLILTNEMENCVMEIKNCTVGEVITIDGDTQIITSSVSKHKIYNDFNYEYFRIGNTINNRNNKIAASLPCKIELKYSPVIKDIPE